MEDGTPTSLSHLCDTDHAQDMRRILDLVGDKWSLLVIFALRDGTQRFSELRRRIEPISQRMLTRTLRQLERNGLVERVVYPTIPPRVEYTLTALGVTLLSAINPLLDWLVRNQPRLMEAIREFDAAQTDGDATESNGHVAWESVVR